MAARGPSVVGVVVTAMPFPVGRGRSQGQPFRAISRCPPHLAELQVMRLVTNLRRRAIAATTGVEVG